MSLHRAVLLAFLVFLGFPSLAHAAGVSPRFDLSSPEGAPFPSNRWTDFDFSQKTGLRVDLPKPDCAVRPSDCADIDVLNTLDGFNLQPRISIPFTGPIDPASVDSSNVFLVRVPDLKVTGINQIMWEVATNTLARRVRPAAPAAHALSPGRHDRYPRRLGPADPLGLLPPDHAQRHVRARARAPRKASPAGRRRRNRLHDAERDGSARAGAPPDQGFVAGARGLPARRGRRADGLPARRRDVDPLLPADGHGTGVQRQPDRDAVPLPLRGEHRHRRVRELRLAGLPDGVEGDSGHGYAHGRPGGAGDEPGPLQPVPAGRDRAHGRLARRDLRARFRRQQEREPVPRRVVDGPPRDRDDRDQRRRPRRRRPRDADREPVVGPAGRPSCGRPRHRPGRQRDDRLDRGRERGRAAGDRLEPRRPPPDRDRPDAARARARGRDGRRRERDARPRPVPDLVLRPVVRRHLRDEVPRRRAERAHRRRRTSPAARSSRSPG